MAVTSKYFPAAEKGARRPSRRRARSARVPDVRPAAARGDERMVMESMIHHLLEILGGVWYSGVPGCHLLFLCLGLYDRQRTGCGWRDASILLGRLPRQYRVLDRYQSRWYIYLRDPARDESGIPPPVHARRRVDDHLRPDPGWSQHLHAPRSCLAGVLAVPDPKRAAVVAQLPLAVDVGSAGDHHIRSRQYDVSVPAAHPGPGNGA